MSHSPSDGQKQVPPLNREVSLPTYEEATEKVQPTAPASLVEQTSVVINNVNEPVEYNSRPLPVYQPDYQSISPRSTQNIGTGLQQFAHTTSQYQDPALHEMAKAVTEECRRAKRTRKWKRIGMLVGAISAIAVFIVCKLRGTESPHYRRHKFIG